MHCFVQIFALILVQCKVKVGLPFYLHFLPNSLHQATLSFTQESNLSFPHKLMCALCNPCAKQSLCTGVLDPPEEEYSFAEAQAILA